MNWLAVAAGGALGSTLRHGLNQRASNRIQLSETGRTFLAVGVLGGFTTFSSFSLDTLTLIRSGHVLMAAASVIGQVGLSLFGAWLGFRPSQ